MSEEVEQRSLFDGDDEESSGDVVKIKTVTTTVETVTLKPKKPRKKKSEAVEGSDLLVVKPKKVKAEILPPREQYREQIKSITEEQLIRPWMRTKVFRLITDVAELNVWVDDVLANEKGFRATAKTGEMMPAVAVDTETSGLDTRIVIHNGKTYTGIKLAGVCLSADGVEGLYIPVNHDEWENIDPVGLAEALQRLFDNSLLIFYNGKYDREVLRLTLGIVFRPYPYHEDVQVLQYLKDPKADLGDGVKNHGEAGGLKALSKSAIGIEQIELDELTKMQLKRRLPDGKLSRKSVHVPFIWVPTNLAKWYAAGDAICTWLLWDVLHEEARAIKLPHQEDHELIDSLAWMERQRYHVDVDNIIHSSRWLKGLVAGFKATLVELADQGPDFNPGSPDQIGKLLFGKWKMKVIKRSDKTGIPSADGDVIEELRKLYPDNEFLSVYAKLKEYLALHPENLAYDERDQTARMFLRQTTVAGGRLSATGGDFDKDGGFGMNIQAVKRVEGNRFIKGREIYCATELKIEDVITYELDDLDPKAVDVDEETKEKSVVSGISKNHIGRYFGKVYCLVAKCQGCVPGADISYGPTEKVDANEILNIRKNFKSRPKRTFFTVDYSNIEMRVAANISGEKAFIYEFLEGTGDFHTLTARSVFPHFDNLKDKDERKKLRSLAKIINFALLYGGTEHTIYENMKKEDPTITKDKARGMVDAYWQGVPDFDLWCKKQQSLALGKMICKTRSGRIVHFDSLMKSMRLFKPTGEEQPLVRKYYDMKRKARESEAARDKESQDFYNEKAEALYKDKENGVSNAIEYNKFLGKIQRVSMNIPVQGLAGDFMRMALNRIRMWAQQTLGVENVLEVHGTVHDEVDFSVENEYVPYVLPRLIRIMKLRKLHEKMNWTVPIECDCEYGKTWDVQYHVTGDDKHEPEAWTKVDGMAEYVPGGAEELRRITAFVKAPKELQLQIWDETITPEYNPRISDLVKSIREGIVSGKLVGKDLRHKMIVASQLDEFWNIDQELYEEETLDEYRERLGLVDVPLPPLPPGGWLGSLELGSAEYYPAPNEQLLLGVPESAIQKTEDGGESTPTRITFEPPVDFPRVVTVKPSPLPEPSTVVPTPKPVEKVVEKPVAKVEVKPEIKPEIAPLPSKKSPKLLPIEGIPVLRQLSVPEIKEFQSVLGIGSKKIEYQMFDPSSRCYVVFVVDKCRISEIPEKFLTQL